MPAGQHINKTSSAIRITHLPSGMVVECQDERSQYKNKDKAMRVLALPSVRDRTAETGRCDCGRTPQSGRLGQPLRAHPRTCGFPENRISEHRIKLTLYHLDSFLDGNLDEVLDALITTEQSEKLARSEFS